jgi:dienelactone hydrolase
MNRLLLRVLFAMWGVGGFSFSPLALGDDSWLPQETLEATDLASEMVAGIDRFLDHKLTQSIAQRPRWWHRDFTAPDVYTRSLEPQREDLRVMVGAVDARLPFTGLSLVATTAQNSMVAEADHFTVHRVRWPVFRGVHGEGLLLQPKQRSPTAQVILVPDADQTPEVYAGVRWQDQQQHPPLLALRLATQGCVVVIPFLLNRQSDHSVTDAGRRTNQPHREFVYRPAFEMGRHPIGYEIQKILAVVDWFEREDPGQRIPCGIAGYGEGGLLALYSAALDPRLDTALVSGYFQPREQLWQEPIYRNLFGLLAKFGDAEIASMIAPRPLLIEACQVPEIEASANDRPGRAQTAAPGRWTTPPLASVLEETRRAKELVANPYWEWKLECVASQGGDGPAFSEAAVEGWWKTLGRDDALPTVADGYTAISGQAAPERTPQQLGELLQDTQHLMREGEYLRRDFWSDQSTASIDEFQRSTREYRRYFEEEIIGRLEEPFLPWNLQARRLQATSSYTGFEVKLDVFPDIFACGILLVPQGLKPTEKRPVVVCQHGLEGRPSDLADAAIDHRAYHQFAVRLAERGFIVYAPQNPYIFKDRFRVLQRKLNPLKKTLFSVIVAQHRQTLRWLRSLPFVDGTRIGFYGLSYGGKTAMRVPAILEDYCLSICSGDFNEWIWKTTSLRETFTYPATGEYEMFEFNLGNTYNYAEMAALIAPRPFMVERGHRDGVGIDSWVNYEFAKVRWLYTQLGIPQRTTIEHFDGPHEIHGLGTFEFLHHHLGWPKP